MIVELNIGLSAAKAQEVARAILVEAEGCEGRDGAFEIIFNWKTNAFSNPAEVVVTFSNDDMEKRDDLTGDEVFVDMDRS